MDKTEDHKATQMLLVLSHFQSCTMHQTSIVQLSEGNAVGFKKPFNLICDTRLVVKNILELIIIECSKSKSHTDSNCRDTSQA